MKFLCFILLVLLVAEQYYCAPYYFENDYDNVYHWRHGCFGSHYHRRFHAPWYRSRGYDLYEDYFGVPEDNTTDKLLNVQPLDQPEGKPLGQLSDQASDNLLQKTLDKHIDTPLDLPLEKPLDRPLDQSSKAALYLLLDQPLDQPLEEPLDKILD